MGLLSNDISTMELFQKIEIDQRAGAIQSLLDQLTPIYTIEYYRQLVLQAQINEILLEQIDSNSFNVMEFIANLCPYAGGESVYKARAWMDTYFEDSIFFYDNLFVCEEQGYSTKMIDNMFEDEITLVNRINPIIIYPNPVKNTIHIKNLDKKQEYRFNVSSSNGIELMKGEFGYKAREVIPVNLLPGVYFLHIETDNFSIFLTL